MLIIGSCFVASTYYICAVFVLIQRFDIDNMFCSSVLVCMLLLKYLCVCMSVSTLMSVCLCVCYCLDICTFVCLLIHASRSIYLLLCILYDVLSSILSSDRFTSSLFLLFFNSSSLLLLPPLSNLDLVSVLFKSMLK